LDGVPGFLEQRGDGVADVLLVIDDEHRRAIAHEIASPSSANNVRGLDTARQLRAVAARMGTVLGHGAQWWDPSPHGESMLRVRARVADDRGRWEVDRAS